jgi:hypothetical protein
LPGGLAAARSTTIAGWSSSSIGPGDDHAGAAEPRYAPDDAGVPRDLARRSGRQHPDPYTLVAAEDVQTGRFRVNPAIADALGLDPACAERHLGHYTSRLAERGKYDLTIWSYHAMLGVGHALVSAVEEAICFHSIARCCPFGRSNIDWQLVCSIPRLTSAKKYPERLVIGTVRPDSLRCAALRPCT